MQQKANEALTSNNFISKRAVSSTGAPLPIYLMNTPHENWLLWNFRKGKESQKITHDEIKIL